MSVETDAIMALCEHPSLTDGCELCAFRREAAAEHIRVCVEKIESMLRDLKSP